jgi:acrylyl-CoA reductase (NADPH)
MFRAIVVRKDPNDPTGKALSISVESVGDELLIEADEHSVDVRVDWSTVNYKDALALSGKPIVRKFPLIAGIDFAGKVESSRDPRFEPGQAVVLNGWGVGETHSGGLAQRARVPADWLLALPDSIDTRRAMAIGTAGYTAALCVDVCTQALTRDGIEPGAGDVLVTGASGGVGSIAVALLAKAGHRVVAVTGKADQTDWLRSIGAAEVLPRSDFDAPGKPLGKERWAGAVDCVGSHTLVNVCASLRYGATVAATGLAQGMDFPASVAPFILRGISLVGVDSVQCPMPRRQAAWGRLARDLTGPILDVIASREISLEEALGLAPELLAGRVRGRVIVDVNR